MAELNFDRFFEQLKELGVKSPSYCSYCGRNSSHNEGVSCDGCGASLNKQTSIKRGGERTDLPILPPKMICR